MAQLVRRAERAGFKAIALTVDTPRLGRREADIKNRFISLSRLKTIAKAKTHTYTILEKANCTQFKYHNFF